MFPAAAPVNCGWTLCRMIRFRQAEVWGGTESQGGTPAQELRNVTIHDVSLHLRQVPHDAADFFEQRRRDCQKVVQLIDHKDCPVIRLENINGLVPVTFEGDDGLAEVQKTLRSLEREMFRGFNVHFEQIGHQNARGNLGIQSRRLHGDLVFHSVCAADRGFAGFLEDCRDLAGRTALVIHLEGYSSALVGNGRLNEAHVVESIAPDGFGEQGRILRQGFEQHGVRKVRLRVHQPGEPAEIRTDIPENLGLNGVAQASHEFVEFGLLRYRIEEPVHIAKPHHPHLHSEGAKSRPDGEIKALKYPEEPGVRRILQSG